MLKKLVDRIFRRPRGPQRIVAAEHGIDRRNVSRHAIKVCEVLQQHGHEAYIVGGAVRDLIAGVEPKDFDVATSATPEQIQPLFRRARIIGKRFRLVHVVFGAEIIETSTFRAPSGGEQSTDEHGRILRDNVFGTALEDAVRRDFTLNALYYDPTTEEVIDYHHGVADLKRRLVRIIGDPVVRYREDPVRMLRAVRFAAKLNGQIEEKTLAPIASMAPLIENVPASRLFDEMLKLLTCGHAMDCLRQLRAQGLHHGMLPMLDVVLEQPGGERFIELALERTDARVRAGKSISPSFLFAALLWQQVHLRWQHIQAGGEHSIPALSLAVDSVLGEQTEKLAIQRRFVADMRDIWFMQPRFERRVGKLAWRMIEQPRFRAACDFLQLRAAAGEVDSVLAQWWMDLADANDEDRADMIEDATHAPPAAATPDAPARRRRRRRKP
ncbi:polynucleotide adenylyltransferase PcnB, partial [Achromobacter sp. GG226]|uniref:polynucleotide adenylyltransferase PcnB n=1 Tax=Verticiella alkaliphila TaxID=2779529 RepID=UPI001C0DD5B0